MVVKRRCHSVLCSPENWALVLCVPPSPPHKTIQCYVFPSSRTIIIRIKQNKRKYLNKRKLSRHNDNLSLHRDIFFLSSMMWQQNLLFVSFILHHRKKGKHPNDTYLMKLYLAFSCSFFHSHEIKLVEAKWHKALCKSCMY